MSAYQEAFDDLTLWPRWDERFGESYRDYITPNNSEVARAVKEADPPTGCCPEEMAIDCWLWVWENIEYSLSQEWKTPQQTIREGVGDCEDMTFLLASMFTNLGLSGTEIVAGYLHKPNKEGAPHTWNKVNGLVVDGTGAPEEVPGLTYDRELAYTININTK